MASALKSLHPYPNHTARYFGKATLLGTLVVAIPDGAKRILHAHGVPSLVKGGTAATEANKLTHLTHQIADDGKSVTFYGWKATGAGDTTLIASTADAEISFELECEVI